MSPTFSMKFPSVGRALAAAGLPLLLAIGSPRSSWAQNAPTHQRDSASSGPRKEHRQMGPVAPAILRDSIGVTGSALQQYTRRYDSHMAATKPARDSLRSAMQEMRSSFKRGDRSAARDRRQAIRSQFDGLAKRDQQFEASLKDLLSQDQQKRYAQWKEDQRNMARMRWHHDRSGRGGDESRPRG